MNTGQIQQSLALVRERISEAARKAGRRAEEITLIGVSKTHPAESIRAGFDAGLRHFGENRVQEWENKRAQVADLHATWHLVGHLQSNKASRAAAAFHSVDSIDDFALAQRLSRACLAGQPAQKLRVLLEVRLAPEETKSGIEPEKALQLAEKVAHLAQLDLAGLMCIPPFRENPEEARPHFARLRELREQIAERLGRALPVLSMGMSHDFAAAIAEGATEVRIGTAIFGDRPMTPK